MRIPAYSALLLTATTAWCQDVFVPTEFAAVDAYGPREPLPGTHLDARMQVLVAASQLSALTPGVSVIESLSFRRDGSDSAALAAGTARLTIELSSPATAPGDASESFAANRGPSPVRVFDGLVSLPSSPSLTHRNEPDWSARHSVTIRFTTPFLYEGGALCIELDGRRRQVTRWPIDYMGDAPAGRVSRVGLACGPISRVSRHTADTSPWFLTPGSTVRLAVMEEHGALAMLLLGSRPFAPPIDLDVFGAPGCQLHVSPLISPTASVSRRPGRGPNHPGIGQVRLHLPSSNALSGARLYAQWVNVVGRQLTTSDALVLDLGGGVPSRLTVVSSGRHDGLPLPGTGRVRSGAGPVMKLTVR